MPGDADGAARCRLAGRQPGLRTRPAGAAPATARRAGGRLPARRLRAAAVRAAARRSRPATTSPARRMTLVGLLGRAPARARRRRSCARRRRTTPTTRTSSWDAPPQRALEAHPGPRRRSGCGACGRDLPVPDADRALRPRAARARSSTRSRRTPPSSRACRSTGCSRRARSATPASPRSACTARASPAIPRSSSPSCSARSMLTPSGWQLGAPRRFDADAPFASPSARPIGWWLRGRVGARAAAPRDVISARRCAARRARSGTRA